MRINNKLSEIDVLILCGGMGNRLREVVNDRPKPMAMINQQPFLDILIEYFSSFGFRRFILCTGHMSDVIQNHYESNTQYHIIISGETYSLGTAGSIKNAEKHIKTESFLVANGDSFCSADLDEFYNFHETRNTLMSMVATQSEDVSDYGTVVLGNQNKVIEFREKDKNETNGFINAGIYLFQKEILASVPPNTKYSLEYELFPKLLKKNIYAFISRNELIDIGTPERLEEAKEYFTKYQALCH
jgi:NDP-sugar pyrophosphorylase family protein